ncbi:DUF2752 domain-containing protein [Streptomyces sp. NPDC056937]|uniref:DUF2752 domain-containing protein n=1 Tax=Streptomyces sp. NPDC056937 TaxID=3345969 RepID=UPI0036325534
MDDALPVPAPDQPARPAIPPPAPVAPPVAARPPATARRLLAPLATLGGVAAAFTYVGLVDPNETGHYPVCPLYALTGLLCFGCGGLRSAHAVAHGDWLTALGDNALATVGYPLFAVLWVVWLVRARKGLPVALTLRPVWWWVLGGVILAFSVIRNVPFGSSLAP